MKQNEKSNNNDKIEKKNYVHVLSFRFDRSHISPYKKKIRNSTHNPFKDYIAEEPISIQFFHCQREKLSLKMCTEVGNFVVFIVYFLESSVLKINF